MTGKTKTWTGPAVTVDSQTVTAGGNTQWKKHITADKKTTTVTSWLCQTATATQAFTSDNVAQVFLWDKSASKDVKLWQFKNDELKYQNYVLNAAQTTIEDEKNVKEQIDGFKINDVKENNTKLAKVEIVKSSGTW